jgi:hypothetical protein
MFIIYIIAAAVAVIIIIFIIVVIVFICCCCCKRSSGEKHYDLKKEVNNKKSSKSGLWQDEGGSAFQPNVAYSPTDYTDQRGRSLTNDYENNTTTSSFAGRDTEKLTGISSFTAASETSRQTDV